MLVIITNNVMTTIQKLSPTNLYEDATSDILGVFGGLMGGQGLPRVTEDPDAQRGAGG